MIIRATAFQKSAESRDLVDEALDMEAAWFVIRKHGFALGLIALFAGLLVYLLTMACKEWLYPPQVSIQLDPQAQVLWGLPLTENAKIDALLPVLEPTKELAAVFAEGFPLNTWSGLLEGAGLVAAGNVTPKSSSRFQVVWGKNRTIADLEAEIDAPRNKPAFLLVRGGIPQKNLERLTARWAQILNEQVGSRYLDMAKKKKNDFSQEVEEEEKNHLADFNRIRALTAKDSKAKDDYLSNLAFGWVQRRARLDRLLGSLDQNCLPNPVFLVGETSLPAIPTLRQPWALSLAAFAGTIMAGLLYLYFIGPPSQKILSEPALAAIYPQASVYSTPRDAAVMDNLLSASMSRCGLGKVTKMAAFIPQKESALIEKVRRAAEKSGHSLGADGSLEAGVVLFSLKDPSDEICRLPTQGFGRILLVAKQGESLKSCHRLYQAEADLAGIIISDVLLIGC